MNNLFWYLLIMLLLLDFGVTTVYASRKYVRFSGLLHIREQTPEAVDRTINLLEKPYLDTTLTAAWVINHLLLSGLVFWFIILQYSALTQNPWFMLGSALLVAILILALEFIFEGIILRDSQSWMVRLTPLGELIYFIFRPFAWMGGFLLRSSAGTGRIHPETMEEELKTWVEVGQAEGGTLEQEERQMIYSIFQFSETLCREIMVPRIDVLAVEASTPMLEAIPRIIESGHSRIPVYKEVIDNVVGILYAKDLLKPTLDGEEGKPISTFVRKAYFVPEAKKVDELLREMQALGVHIAVVVDEYGGMAGLVSLEDIVEEIVGEIRDEYDQREELLYQVVGDDEFLFLGRIDIDDFNDVTGTHVTREVADTLGGYIYGEIGRVPAQGEKITIEDWTLVVEEVIGRRIRRVRAIRKLKEEDNANGKDSTG